MSLTFLFVVALVLWLWGRAQAADQLPITKQQTVTQKLLVNDVHSQLNPTIVADIVRVSSVEEVQTHILKARAANQSISISGGRHAMGGQQFGKDTVLLDMRGMNRVLRLDPKAGRVTVESGIQWPALIDYLVKAQAQSPRPWGIAQKQTGADALTLGGAMAANIHSRGLRMKPFISNIVSFELVNASGKVVRCSRSENGELFRLAVGGYGLFGVVTQIELQLVPRQKVKRVVEMLEAKNLVPKIERCTVDGALYGDFQFSTDPGSSDFLNRGVLSCYYVAPLSTIVPQRQRELKMEDWRSLYLLAHTDKKAAFERYSKYYLGTQGQLYWSDLHQLTPYPDHYHAEIDRTLHTAPASEMITEVYVPRESLSVFLDQVRRDFRENQVDLFYGTVRFIQSDQESFLAWAKKPYACVIFNLHTAHDAAALAKTQEDFRRLIDRAIALGGSYYLTYHRWATRKQVEAAYPQMSAFLELKRKYDPQELFQSDWYRYYRSMFSPVTEEVP